MSDKRKSAAALLSSEDTVSALIENRRAEYALEILKSMLNSGGGDLLRGAFELAESGGIDKTRDCDFCLDDGG